MKLYKSDDMPTFLFSFFEIGICETHIIMLNVRMVHVTTWDIILNQVCINIKIACLLI